MYFLYLLLWSNLTYSGWLEEGYQDVDVGNNTNVSKNTKENKGALIEISKELTREQTLNRIMSAHTHGNNSKRVKWKDEFEEGKQQ